MITENLKIPLRNSLLCPLAILRLIRAVFLPLDHVSTACRGHAYIKMIRSESPYLLVKTLILDLSSARIESTLLVLLLVVATLRLSCLLSSQGCGRAGTRIRSSLRFAACAAIFVSVGTTRMSELGVAS